jgi:hypothetical protein
MAGEEEDEAAAKAAGEGSEAEARTEEAGSGVDSKNSTRDLIKQ